jgi:hypothetical protein
MGRPDYDYSKGLEIRAYELADGQCVETNIPGGTGTPSVATIRVEKKNGEVKVNTLKGKCEITSLSLFGENIKDATGGRVESSRIVVEAGATEVIAKI